MALRLLLAALLLICALPARAEWREVPYADAVKMPLGLQKSDPEGVFTAYFKLLPGKGQATLPAGLQFKVRAGAETVAVPIGPGGEVRFPLRQDWADGDAVVLVNQPKGSFRMTFAMTARTPPGTRMTYAILAESAAVLERGVRDMAGLMSLFAPKVKGLLLDFEPGTVQTVEVQFADGKRRTFRSDAKGRARLPWEPDWADATIVLSAPLKTIDPELK
jgi:hypothetical protein